MLYSLTIHDFMASSGKSRITRYCRQNVRRRQVQSAIEKTYKFNRFIEKGYAVRKVWVVGAGVVGEATGKGLIDKGNDVIFIDKVPDVVKRLTGAG